MTTATKITLVRFAFVPPVVVAVCGAAWWPAYAGRARAAAAVLFFLAALTDCLDGYVARRFKQESRLGAALDPVADKLLLGAAIWAIWASQSAYTVVPLWYPVVVSVNDLVLVLGFFAVRHRINPDEFRAMAWGKLATMAQMLVVVWLLIGWPEARILIAVTAATTAVSGTAYVVRAVRLMGRIRPQAQDT